MQCGRVGSRPLSTTEGFQGHVPWEPSLHLEERPTPSPSLRREGSVMPRQATSEASKGVHFLLELHVANECRVVVCIRQWGPCLVSDCRGHTLCLIAGGHALRPIAGGACLPSDCRGCACVRLQGLCLRPIAGAVPCAGFLRRCPAVFQSPAITSMHLAHSNYGLQV